MCLCPTPKSTVADIFSKIFHSLYKLHRIDGNAIMEFISECSAGSAKLGTVIQICFGQRFQCVWPSKVWVLHNEKPHMPPYARLSLQDWASLVETVGPNSGDPKLLACRHGSKIKTVINACVCIRRFPSSMQDHLNCPKQLPPPHPNYTLPARLYP
jgi:hypothetical protein